MKTLSLYSLNSPITNYGIKTNGIKTNGIKTNGIKTNGIKKMPIIITTRLIITTLLLLSGFLLSTASQATAHATPLIARAGTDQVVQEGQKRVRLDSTSSGPGLTYTWRQISGLTVSISSDDATSNPFFFNAPDKIFANQTLVFGLVVTDQHGRDSEEDTVVFTIQTVTPGVVADAGLDQTVTAGDTVTLDASGSSGGLVPFYLWSGGRSNGGEQLFNNHVGQTQTFLAVNESNEDIVLSFLLTFGEDVDTVRITVRPRSTPANTPPVADADEAQNAFAGATVTLDGRGSRDDEDDSADLTYAWTQTAPRTNQPGADIDLNTNRDGSTSIRPTFVVPADLAVGTELVFSLTVTDSRGVQSIDSAEVTITIIRENQVATFAGDVSGTITEDATTITGSITVSDNDGDNAVQAQDISITTTTYGFFGISAAGEWHYTLVNTLASVNGLAVGATLTDTITVMAADGTPETITITITGVNDAPTAIASVAAPTVVAGGTVSLQGAGTDPDTGDSITRYTWSQSLDNPSQIMAENIAGRNPSFTVPSAGVYTFSLVVSDGSGANNADSAPDSVTITVTPPPPPRDTIAPRVISIERTTPANEVTNADSLTWTITFSENVRGVGDFGSFDFGVIDSINSGNVVTVGNGVNITTLSVGNTAVESVYTVTVTGLVDSLGRADFNGAATLGFGRGYTIEDTAGNRLVNTLPTTGTYEFYTLDNIAPTVTIARSDRLETPVSGDFPVTFTFNEAVTGFELDDIMVTNGRVRENSFDSSRSPQYTAIITPTVANNAAITVAVPAYGVQEPPNGAQDTAGNGNTAADSLSVMFTFVDTIPPRVISIVRTMPTEATTNADSLTWTVTFNEDVGDVDAGDFEITDSNAALVSVNSVPDVDSVYTVTATGDDLENFNGTVTLGFVDGQNITDTASNALIDTTPTGTNEPYTLDNTAPMVTSIERTTPTNEVTNANSLTWTVTFNENVRGVDAGDFKITDSNAALVSVNSVSVVMTSPDIYTVTASGSDLADLNGVVTLGFVDGQNITDTAPNALIDTTPTGTNDPTYILENSIVALTAAADQVYTAGIAISNLILPEATGGDGNSYTYTLTDGSNNYANTIDGLTFNPNSRTLSGTPTAMATVVSLSYTVTDGLTNATATFTISVPNGYSSSVVSATSATNADGLTVIILGQSSNINVQAAGATITLPNGLSGTTISIAEASNNVPTAQPDETVPNLRLSLVDIDVTGVSNSNPVTICLPHDGINDPGLYHAATSNGWNLLPSQQVVGELVCGEATAFSPFAVFGNMRALGADAEAQIINAVLPQLLRATTKMTVDTISQRIDQALDASGSSDASLNIGGSSNLQQLLNNNIHTALHKELDVKQMLNNSSFLIPLNVDGDNNNGLKNMTLWGSGDYLNLADDVAGVDWEGEVIGARVGIDAHLKPNLIAGAALAYSVGDVSYTRDGTNNSSGSLSNTLYSIHPYLAYDLSQGRLWGTLGYGQGELTINDTASNATADTVKTNRDSQLFSLAFGANRHLLSNDNWLNIPGTTTLRLKGEVSLSNIKLDKSQLINAQALSINAHRYRMVLEGSQQHTLAGGASVSPSVELGIRYDAGSDETGGGIELAGNYRYSDPKKGFNMELRAHTLLLHQSDYQEWGLSGLVKYQTNNSGQGLQLSLQPAWGATPGNVADRIWQASAVTSYANDTNEADSSNKKLQLNSELGYGLPGLYGYGLLTPYTGLGIANGEQSYNIGARWAIDPASRLNLIGEHKQSGDSIQLRGDFRF